MSPPNRTGLTRGGPVGVLLSRPGLGSLLPGQERHPLSSLPSTARDGNLCAFRCPAFGRVPVAFTPFSWPCGAPPYDARYLCSAPFWASWISPLAVWLRDVSESWAMRFRRSYPAAMSIFIRLEWTIATVAISAEPAGPGVPCEWCPDTGHWRPGSGRARPQDPALSLAYCWQLAHERCSRPVHRGASHLPNRRADLLSH
jgi:hypothetical protein